MLKNIEADAARDILCALETTLRTETVPLSEASGRVLAADITAPNPDAALRPQARTMDKPSGAPILQAPRGSVPAVLRITGGAPSRESADNRDQSRLCR